MDFNSEIINKHTTKMSLNERFTIIQTIHPSAVSTPHRRRRRSQSVNAKSSSKSSLQNRRLLERLDQKHIMRIALRLKKKSSRTNVQLRQRLNNQSKNRVLKRGISVGPSDRLKRANRNIGKMQPDLIAGGRAQLRRSNSGLNLDTSRLSDRIQIAGHNSRRQLIRNNVATQRSRSRSRSRQNLISTNSQTNLRRINSKETLNILKRDSNSQVRGRSVSRQRSASRQNSAPPQQNAPRLRSASRQRSHLQRLNSRGNLNNENGFRSRSDTRTGANRQTINGRFGVKRLNQKGSVNVQHSRITKRRNSNLHGDKGIINAIGRSGARQRTGRSRTRVALTNIRNRSASRGRNGRHQPNNNFNQDNRSRQVHNGGPVGGSRSRSRGRLNAANKHPAKSKEQLDKELDQYMVNAKNEVDLMME